MELASLPERMNRALPAGIRVLSAYESDRKIRQLAFLQAEITLEYDAGIPDGAQEAIAALFVRECVLVHKRTKRGEADVDLIPCIRALSLTAQSAQELRLDATVTAMNPALNPQLLAEAIRTHLPQYAPDFARVHRREILDAAGEIFR